MVADRLFLKEQGCVKESRRLPGRLSIEHDLAFDGREKTRDHPKERRLSGTVPAATYSGTTRAV